MTTAPSSRPAARGAVRPGPARSVPARARVVAAATAFAVALSCVAAAAAPAAASECDSDTEARLEFLESRLDEGRDRAQLWWRSWMGIFVIGVGFSTVNGALEDDGSNAAADYINAGKSVLGIADLTLRPHVARHGAERVRAIPKTTPERCRERLALAEKSMEQAADAGSQRWAWKAHLSSLVLNLAAALAVSEGWDDPGDGWRDFGISSVSGEANIWTHPTRAVDDWSDYRQRFDGAPAAARARDLRFAASPLGVRLRWNF